MFEVVLEENKNEHFADSSTLFAYVKFTALLEVFQGYESPFLSSTSIVLSLHLGEMSARFTAMTGELVVDGARLILKIL